MNDVLRLARPDILELQPYQHAAWNPTLERMHANEMPWRATGDVSDAGLNRYPEPPAARAARRLARSTGLPASRSSRPRQRRGHRPPGARFLPRRAGPGGGLSANLRLLLGCRAHPGRGGAEVPLRAGDFGLDLAAVSEAGRTPSWCSLLAEQPHGPAARRGAILEVLRVLAAKALIVVDEAYIEFSMRASLASRLAGSRTSWCSVRCPRPMRLQARAVARCSPPRRSSVCSGASCRRTPCPPRP